MLKHTKFFGAIALILLLSSSVHAQVRLGTHASFMTLFGGTGVKTFGLNANGEYAKSEKLAFTGTLGYYFPGKIESTTYGNAMSSTTSPNQIEVPVTYSISFIYGALGAKYYFINEFEDDFAVYGLADIGIMLAPTKVTVGEYDRSLYYTTEQDGETETLGNYTLGLGAGAEYNVGVGYLFGDLKLVIPAGSYNSRTGAEGVEVPGCFLINAGIKFPIGG
jgi:hypothetical protein